MLYQTVRIKTIMPDHFRLCKSPYANFTWTLYTAVVPALTIAVEQGDDGAVVEMVNGN